MTQIETLLMREYGLKESVVKNVAALLDEGNTIPFIARYRKEMTGAMDDQTLRELAERLAYLKNMENRKQEVIEAVRAQGNLTEEWERRVHAAGILAEVEDLYRPFKQKRRTRGMLARERGLEPLARIIMEQKLAEGDMERVAVPFVDAEKDVPDAQGALAGAMDIIAEDFSEDAGLRRVLRALMQKHARIATSAAKEEDSVYRLYYDFSEEAARMPSHRILAVNRGEKEGFLKVKADLDGGAMVSALEKYSIKNDKSITAPYIRQAARDAWGRLLFPSLERELRSALTDKANEQAIKMFGQNLLPALMQPPLTGKVVLGFDPAYRTGCKLACVSETGKVLDVGVIYPTPPNNKVEQSKETVKKLIAKHNIEVIAIGNGTASKESELFIAALLKEVPGNVCYTMVNEAGASVYSASKLGAQEFPDYDVSLRSAVSIARRLQDPMAELVKIDPKAIGVGQYQHDMPVKKLDETLRGVVESCVNSVGVDVNTASPSLLSYVAGVTARAAQNILLHREENGAFSSRAQIKKVNGLGPKAFEQCAGFLRVPGGANRLDNTAVHPESYGAAKKLLGLFGYTEGDIGAGGLLKLAEQACAYGEEKAAEECSVGVPTLRDIIGELQKPGRDIRENLPKPALRSDVLDITSLAPGMEFTGTVRNVIDFGAFVDIGVHQDGLVHISRMANRYVKHPSDVCKVGDVVRVWVLSVDAEKNRISLSMVGPEAE